MKWQMRFTPSRPSAVSPYRRIRRATENAFHETNFIFRGYSDFLRL
jgi:hypothetical protein